jgi:hypothetical protein
MSVKSLLPILCLAGGMVPLCGQQTEAGIQGSVLFPQQALRQATDGHVGFELGVHAAIDLQGGNEIRPRLDYTRIDGGSFSGSSLTGTTSVQGVGLGADYLRYLEDTRRGLYGAAGLELFWWNTKYRFSGSDRLTTPMVMIGVGHRFNANVAAEFDIDFGQFRSSVGTASSIKGGIFYRF